MYNNVMFFGKVGVCFKVGFAIEVDDGADAKLQKERKILFVWISTAVDTRSDLCAFKWELM